MGDALDGGGGREESKGGSVTPRYTVPGGATLTSVRTRATVSYLNKPRDDAPYSTNAAPLLLASTRPVIEYTGNAPSSDTLEETLRVHEGRTAPPLLLLLLLLRSKRYTFATRLA